MRVEANGICRTDWALWAGDFWVGGPELAPPFVLGHEFAGTIVEVCAENAALVEYGQPLFRVAE